MVLFYIHPVAQLQVTKSSMGQWEFTNQSRDLTSGWPPTGHPGGYKRTFYTTCVVLTAGNKKTNLSDNCNNLHGNQTMLPW